MAARCLYRTAVMREKEAPAAFGDSGTGLSPFLLRADLSPGRARASVNREAGRGERRGRTSHGARGLRKRDRACARVSETSGWSRGDLRRFLSCRVRWRAFHGRKKREIGFPGGEYAHLFYTNAITT
jgi:hypothetical protein